MPNEEIQRNFVKGLKIFGKISQKLKKKEKIMYKIFWRHFWKKFWNFLHWELLWMAKNILLTIILKKFGNSRMSLLAPTYHSTTWVVHNSEICVELLNKVHHYNIYFILIPRYKDYLRSVVSCYQSVSMIIKYSSKNDKNH